MSGKALPPIEVPSTTLPLVHNITGRAYVLGGTLCQDEEAESCIGSTASVEMLDMSLGAWQAFPVPLGEIDSWFQFATLDHELGTS